ncbi:MAG: SRPBCC family protein, partial [Actinomycetota bacterium]|nr:SRPBCC family protein [Actinomycetota bacterium]
FADVIATDGYPLAGGTLVWRTGAAGRGEITEEVIGHEPRTRHRIRFQDPTMRGELETRFALEGTRTRISQSMSYALAERGVFAFLGALFVRSQVRRSIERSLEAFRSYAGERPPR